MPSDRRVLWTGLMPSADERRYHRSVRMAWEAAHVPGGRHSSAERGRPSGGS
jgi:hypothetical protein